MRPSIVSALVGLATYVAIATLIAVAVGAFRGSFTPTAPVTVLSPRAGLVMNESARVTMRGIEVGKVASIEVLPNGKAALHLAMDPSQLHLIPANVLVEIAPPTAFGAKYVQLIPPAEPSPQPIHAGQVLDARHVTVEINTVFDQLTAVLSKIEPVKLNETLGAIAKALNGRGHKLGRALGDLDEVLAKVEPGLPALSHDIAVAPDVLNAYADAAPDLIRTADNATRISQTIVAEQDNLDAFLISAIGLADIGNDVVGTNRQALTDVLRLLVPTTDLTNRYSQSLNCGLAGMVPLATSPPLPFPGVVVSVSFTLGVERYRYPHDLPKVAATGAPQCQLLPKVPLEQHPPFVVMDVGANPTQYGNQGILLNSDALKQLLFGPIDGPPRNTAQVGQPG
ncbi:MAG TPA: MCE family protein [Mycobacterium sp.]|uniref:MCE family protein n=1 Tax=Mycobacterium sp. TaxID=1785 RepID=UPI002D379677|nr:MCE family protein [Mycobacterium sp.]HXY66900.1 MCE family protein [Mycobacterium sp.]